MNLGFPRYKKDSPEACILILKKCGLEKIKLVFSCILPSDCLLTTLRLHRLQREIISTIFRLQNYDFQQEIRLLRNHVFQNLKYQFRVQQHND